VAYIPNGTVIGLRKIPRIDELYARHLQVQEGMIAQIANLLQDVLNLKDVAVVGGCAHVRHDARGEKIADQYDHAQDVEIIR